MELLVYLVMLVFKETPVWLGPLVYKEPLARQEQLEQQVCQELLALLVRKGPLDYKEPRVCQELLEHQDYKALLVCLEPLEPLDPMER